MLKLKKSISIFLSLVVVLMGMGGLTSAHSSYADTSDKGYVTVTIEDSLPIPEGSGYPEPKGVIVDHVKVPFSEGDSMADCIRTACDLESKEIEITGEGLEQYIRTIDGLSEKQKGPQSGWYITFNGTFLNMGSGFYRADLAELEEWQNEQLKTSTKYKKQNMEKYHLKDGDDIHMYYTQKDLGGDLGDNAGPSVIKSITPSQGSLSPEFNSDVKEYTLDIGETDTANVVLNPVALHGFSSMDNINGKYHTRIIKGNEVYRPTDTIRVKDGDILKVRCGEYEEVIDTESTGNSVTEYTVKVKANKTGTEPAEGQEENVELRFSTLSLEPGKHKIEIKDENNKIVETTSLKIDYSEAIEADPKVIGYSYRPLNVKLRPGTYYLKTEEKYTDSSKEEKTQTFRTKINVAKGHNDPIILFLMDYCSYTEGKPSDNKLIVKNEKGEYLPIDRYNRYSYDEAYDIGFNFNYYTFILQARDNAKYSITEINNDKNARLDYETSFFADGTFEGVKNQITASSSKASFQDKGNKLYIELTGEDLKTFISPSIDTEWTNIDYHYEIRYPKDLENFQVFLKNTKAYEEFVPLINYKDKYRIKEWVEDKTSSEDFNIIKFTSDFISDSFLFTGGGVYFDKEKSEYKNSKYVKQLISAFPSDGENLIYKLNFLKTSDIDEDVLSFKKYKAWWGIPIENSLLTDIIDEGQYKTLKKDEVLPFYTFRIAQGTDGDVGNTIVEPDKIYRVYGDSVSISDPKGGMGREWNDVKALKKGASIVAIGYGDAARSSVEVDKETETDTTKTFFPSDPQCYMRNDPDRAGIAIFDVDGTGENIDPGVYRKTSEGVKPLRKYDRVHFVKSIEFPDGRKKDVKDACDFVVNPTSKDGKEVKVYYHKPILTQDDFNNNNFYTVPKAGAKPGEDWIPAEKVENGSKVKLWSGNNVLLMQSGENTRYFVVSAKGLNIKTKNLSRDGKPFAKGDKVQFRLRGLELPLPKLSAIYNPGFPDTTYLIGKVNGKERISVKTQYGINFRDWFTDDLKNVDSNTDFSKEGYTIESAKDLEVSDIKIHSGWFGSALDAHTTIGLEPGKKPNLSAGEEKDNAIILFGVFEDFTLPVIHLEYPEKANTKEKSQVKDGKLTYMQGESEAAVIEITNIDGKTFKDVKIDGKSVDKKNYEYDKEKSILTLKKDFLDKLTPGVHKVETISEDGNAEGEFTVEKAEPKYADLTELNKAIDNAKAAVKDVKTSKDGKDIAKADKWVTPETMKAVTDKTAKAEKLVKSKPTEDKKADVEKMTADLNKLTESFKPVAGLKEETKPTPDEPKYADLTELNKAIEKAKAAVKDVKISKDGKDIAKADKWVTPEVMKALTDKTAEAEKLVNSKPAEDKKADVENMTADLNKLTEGFKPVAGLKEETKPDHGKKPDKDNKGDSDKPAKTNTGNTAKTGDNAMTVGYGMIAVILVGATYFVVRRKKDM